MTALEWDKVGERRYQTGIDRGVLYPRSGEAVPWNGLVSINETKSREVKSYYLDGVKYLDHHVPGSYAATLSAFTYPDELEELLGTPQYAPGVFVHDQTAKLFHLAYRTLVGNDTEGTEHGYKLHIVYNVLAVPADATSESLSDSVGLSPFDFALTGTPPTMFGIRPTSHISLDSRLVDPLILTAVEELIYGTDAVDPALPDFVDLLAMMPVEA
jgi:hypothetical protein